MWLGRFRCAEKNQYALPLLQQLRGQTMCAFQVRRLETTLALREPTLGLVALLLHSLHLHALGNLQFEGVVRQRLIYRQLVYRQVDSIFIDWAIDIDCRRKSYAIEITISTIDDQRFEFALRTVDILPDG